MAKASVYIVLFFISFNAGAVMLNTTGVAGDLGLSPTTDRPEELQTAENQQNEFGASQGKGGTLFGLRVGLGQAINKVFNAVLPGAAMIKRAGAPDFFVNFAFAILAIVPGLELIAFLRSGGELI